MSPEKRKGAPQLPAQSAAAPSPFPPIADYAFLSNCHTGALVAPDGAIDWLCVPRFDSPSIFGSLLDRGAGSFLFGPFGINVPTTRAYEPGTNVLVTTWNTPSGWVIVRDALTIGPRRGKDTITPHTRPPADEDADHVLVRTARCLEGSCAGSPSIAPPSSPRSEGSRSWCRAGALPRRRSRRTSSSTGSRTGCYASTTTPTRSTLRRSSRRCSGSCPTMTGGP
jgi:hypothetical protein